MHAKEKGPSNIQCLCLRCCRSFFQPLVFLGGSCKATSPLSFVQLCEVALLSSFYQRLCIYFVDLICVRPSWKLLCN